MIINIIFTSLNLLRPHHTPNIHLLSHGTKTLRQHLNLISRDIIFLNRLSDQNLTCTVGIDIGGIPGVEAKIVGCFEEG
jgi:hypothetical protein